MTSDSTQSTRNNNGRETICQLFPRIKFQYLATNKMVLKRFALNCFIVWVRDTLFLTSHQFRVTLSSLYTLFRLILSRPVTLHLLYSSQLATILVSLLTTTDESHCILYYGVVPQGLRVFFTINRYVEARDHDQDPRKAHRDVGRRGR